MPTVASARQHTSASVRRVVRASKGTDGAPAGRGGAKAGADDGVGWWDTADALDGDAASSGDVAHAGVPLSRSSSAAAAAAAAAAVPPADPPPPSPPPDDGLTLDDLPHQPWAAHARLRRPILLSISLTVFIAALVATGSFFLLLYRREVSRFSAVPLVSRFVPGIVQGVMIIILDPLWRLFALRLTRWENHRTTAGMLDSLVYKRFAFMFVANYGNLFYLAFVRPYIGGRADEPCTASYATGEPDCTVELEYQLLSVIITKSTLQQLIEVAVPWVASAAQGAWARTVHERARRRRLELRRRWRLGRGADVEGGGGPPPPPPTSAAAEAAARPSRYVREARMLPYAHTVEDYGELVIQFGFVALFGAAFPLVCLVALVNNYVETRTDAFKILALFERINADQSGAIDAWLPLLEGLAALSVVTNCGVLVFTARVFDTLGGGWEWWARLLAFFVAEHLLGLVKLVAKAAIKDVPNATVRALARQRFDAARFWGVGWTDAMRGQALGTVPPDVTAAWEAAAGHFDDGTDSEAEAEAKAPAAAAAAVAAAGAVGGARARAPSASGGFLPSLSSTPRPFAASSSSASVGSASAASTYSTSQPSTYSAAGARSLTSTD